MALGTGAIRARAAAFLPFRAPDSNHDALEKDTANGNGAADPSFSRAGTPVNEKSCSEPGQSDLEKTGTVSSDSKKARSPGDSSFAHDRDVRRVVRAIPAWVHPLDRDDEDILHLSHHPLISPSTVQIAHHNTTPWAKSNPNHLVSDQAHDLERSRTPPLPTEKATESGSRWTSFVSATAYPRVPRAGGEIVDEEWLIQNGPDYSRAWLADAEKGDLEPGSPGLLGSRIKRRAWYMRAERTILRSPVVPMVIRMIVWCFSLVALCLAGTLHHVTDVPNTDSVSTPSTYMAIAVDAVALVYLLYIAYDEYSGKPLGLRPAKAKMRLIFLDLFFIVFDSANLSLAFAAIESGACQGTACLRQKALASVLLVALVAWLLTFSISVLRLIERVTGR